MYEGAGTSLAIKEVSRRGTHHCTPTVKYLLETALSSQTQCDYPQEDERRWSTNGPQMATHQWTMNGRFRGGGVGLAARDIDRREDHGISCVKILVLFKTLETIDLLQPPHPVRADIHLLLPIPDSQTKSSHWCRIGRRLMR